MVIRTLAKNLCCLSCVSHIIFLLGVHTHIDTHPRTQIISNHTRTQTHTFSFSHTQTYTLSHSLTLSLSLSLSLSFDLFLFRTRFLTHPNIRLHTHKHTGGVLFGLKHGELTFARKARYVFCVQSLLFVSI